MTLIAVLCLVNMVVAVCLAFLGADIGVAVLAALGWFAAFAFCVSSEKPECP